jgi:WD40 repeat protein
VVAGDGWLATTGGDLRVWTPATAGWSSRELLASAPVSVAASPDGILLAAVEPSTLTVWEGATGTRRVGLAPAAGASLTAVAVGPGGTLVAAAGTDGKLRLWSVAGGQTAAVADAPLDSTAAALAFSADGKQLAVVSATPPGGTTLFAIR